MPPTQVKRQVQPQPDAGPPPPEIIDGEPVFDILLLGPRASGKTILISSFHRRFRTMDKENNYFVRCEDPTKEVQLNKIYEELLNSSGGWPEGNAVVDKYMFRFFHRKGQAEYPLFRIRYHDYPGRFLKGDSEELIQFVKERVSSAHSVLALLDGRKILDRLEGRDEAPDRNIFADLDQILPPLQSCIGRPIHFAITKADLLNAKSHPLSAIRAELMKHPNFPSILQMQETAGSPCYLVPVSAIGGSFAYLDLTRQPPQLKKRPDGIIKPFNIDTCINMTLVDQVRAFSIYDGRRGGVPRSLRTKLGIVRYLLTALGIIREWAPYIGGVFGPLTIGTLANIARWAERNLHRTGASLQSQIDELSEAINSRAAALEAILKIQALRVADFIRKFPDAVLGTAR